MTALDHYYDSTIGRVCVVPRPALDGYTVRGGRPCFVSYQGREFPDILGLRVCDYEAIKPDWVVYQLGDGSFLGASKEVLEGSCKDPSIAWKGHNSINTMVSRLKVLEELPEPLEIPIFHF
jgi:hypothetical protein